MSDLKLGTDGRAETNQVARSINILESEVKEFDMGRGNGVVTGPD